VIPREAEQVVNDHRRGRRDRDRFQLRPPRNRAHNCTSTPAWNPTQPSAYADTSTVVNHDMKVIFPLAGAAILLISLLMLQARLAPLYLMASVMAGFAATLGASVVAFQDIAGHQGLNFQLPIIVYLFVASIGTDYNILMISRLRDEIRAGMSQRSATAIRRAGPTIAAAGVVLATSFALLVPAHTTLAGRGA
jgi:RND superfamily putative drug exporter